MLKLFYTDRALAALAFVYAEGPALADWTDIFTSLYSVFT